MKKIGKREYAAILVVMIILIPILTYLASFRTLAYDFDSYHDLMHKNNVSVGNAEQITAELIAYLGGAEEVPDEFNGRERDHLKDVRVLMQNLLMLFYFCLVAFVSLLLFIYKTLRTKTARKVFFRKMLFWGGMVTIIVPVLLILVPFEHLFDLFHNIFFTSGTWLFSGDDLLIRLYPFGFFYDFMSKILIKGFFIGLLLFFLSLILDDKRRKKQ